MEAEKGKSSYEKINYSLRPAKAIERKMLCDAIRKLSYFKPISSYQYVGFGSTYFSDFSLIHKTIGINKMVSIEKDDENGDRFTFNKPFTCIDTIFKHSNQALHDINWALPTILWLDYDYNLDSSMLKDVTTFFHSAAPGSMFLITVDIKPEKPKDKELDASKLKQYRISELTKRLGRKQLPPDINKRNLGIEGNLKIVREIINDQIAAILNIRNGVIPAPSDQIKYHQLFNFYYNDGTPMLTIGGIIYRGDQEEKISKAEFNKLNYVKEGIEHFEIGIPSLTFKEISALDELLPHGITSSGKIKNEYKKKSRLPNLRQEDIEKYSKVYRFFPTFAETNF